MMAGSAVMATELTTANDEANGSWVIQAQGGLNVIASSPGNWVTFGGVGYSAEGSFGYLFSPVFSLCLLTGYDSNPGAKPSGITGDHLAYTPFQVVGKFNFGGVDFSPYITLGAGIALNAYGFDTASPTASGTSNFTETDFLLSPGLGLSFPLAPKAQFFVQGRVDIDFFSNTFAKLIPFETPQIFIPIQAGLSFDVK